MGSLSLGEIISRMEQAQADSRDHSIAYTVTRNYELGTLSSPKSQVLAEINFIPPSQKDYSVRRVEGNSRGAEIVTKVLAHEAEMATRPERYEITRRNYDFALLGQEVVDGHNCYLLQLSPKRRDEQLLRGRAWVDASDFMIRRIEGQPVKSPSWWIKDLQVTIDYGEEQGVWIQKATKAVADVRMIGTHVLTSREIDLQTTDALNARNEMRIARPAARNHNAGRAVADSAVWVSR